MRRARAWLIAALVSGGLVVDVGLGIALSLDLSPSASARPGGGQSYRGSSSFGSSSRSSSSFGSSSRSSGSSSGFGSSSRSSSGFGSSSRSSSSLFGSSPSSSSSSRSSYSSGRSSSSYGDDNSGSYGGSSYGGSSYGGSSYDGSYGSRGRSSSARSYQVPRDRDVGVFGFFFVMMMAIPVAGVGYFWATNRVSWDSMSTPPEDPLFVPYSFEPPRPRAPSFAALRRADKNFSKIILEDFLYELYTRAVTARASREELALLAPYLSAAATDELRGRGGGRLVKAVDGVVVGSLRITHVKRGETHDRLRVEFESNYTETVPGPQHDGRLGFYAHEAWSLVRKRGVQSRDPASARAFNCPSCGAPVERSQHDACQHCGVRHGDSSFDWLVESITVKSEETRGPTLTGYAEEVGTHDPTLRDDALQRRLGELRQADPAFSEEGLFARVSLIYSELNAAWTSRDWDDAHPYLSDRLWLSMRYWIEAYRAQGLQNLMIAARVTRQQIAKIERDAFFDAITVRVWATAIDQTVHIESGAIVAGGETPREYSEYWTLIRSSTRAGEASDKKSCPNCAAPLAVNMTGNCSHCGVKVTGGEFDWVLSKIEQDESYAG